MNATVPPELVDSIIATGATLRDALIRDLQILVSIPSLTGDEGAVQDAVEEQYRRLGLDIDRWEPLVEDLQAWAEHVTAVDSYAGRPNVVGTWNGAGGGRSARQPGVARCVLACVVRVQVDEAALDQPITNLEHVAPTACARFRHTRAPRAVAMFAMAGAFTDDEVAA